jgi:hypothetical protein
MSAPPLKSFGPRTLLEVYQSLGLRLVAIEGPHATVELRARITPRHAEQVRGEPVDQSVNLAPQVLNFLKSEFGPPLGRLNGRDTAAPRYPRSERAPAMTKSG